ncbi:beta-lactamase/transpeptidase-like protein [Aspergillus alliaceus]|uniref:Beta-lactamase/transpeptidase-like protein n=1 Tax=Petromyces alliaceus TaxID=209559 RepID=A0A5N7C1M3_PETAA|nr:beta-lactamase/transpeptidase-like protein [Aspergillus alliaceus]
MVDQTNLNDSTASFARLEASFGTAIEDGIFPGVVVAATDKTGSLRYIKAFGKSACDGTGVPLSSASVMAFASMTKLMTSIAALQLVERGLIGLDEDAGPLLLDLAQIKILTGWNEDGTPLLRERKNQITLRQLLTHSAGTGYDMTNSELAKLSVFRARQINSGETYGTGIDWAGQLVEKVSGQDLESYMQDNIWSPLGIQRITFWPATKPDIHSHQIQMAKRDPHSRRGVTECFGGQGAYGDMESFLKILFSLLVDDGKLLSRETTAELFKPQLSHPSKHCLNEYIKSHPWNTLIGIFDTELEYDWGLGGILTTQNTPSGRRKGTLLWSGKPDLFWVLPPGSEEIGKMIQIFERTLYSALAAHTL